MSAPDQVQVSGKTPSVAEVIESLRQHEATLSELLERNIRPSEA